MVTKAKYPKRNSNISHKKSFCFQSSSERETESIGTRIAGWIKKYCIQCVIFIGPFGSGKTTLIRGIVKSLTGKNDVSSPSFTIVHEYKYGKSYIYHFDFYRIKHFFELESFGFREYTEKGLVLVEWPEVAIEKIPDRSMKVLIDFIGLKKRKIKIILPEK
ncbi:MAG: tRNA (adenosine(37)-N6)-threonylcarbamoyltransferase complex ATPase subunit type 1 TsaE [Candidatus Omnitrophica bacterium]|nr:tRNA (adenosine(37)-N6)-threonylcarbamoyltransferase complex ATPase subunit type 1 TsaE [Candidatus Omnitrophota bacterium]